MIMKGNTLHNLILWEIGYPLWWEIKQLLPIKMLNFGIKQMGIHCDLTRMRQFFSLLKDTLVLCFDSKCITPMLRWVLKHSAFELCICFY